MRNSQDTSETRMIYQCFFNLHDCNFKQEREKRDKKDKKRKRNKTDF